MSDMIYADLLNCAIATSIAVFLLILCIDDKYKRTKIFIMIVSIIFFVLEILSLITVMTDINYQFLVNLFDSTNFIATFKTNIFRDYILMGVAMFIATIGILYFINKKVRIRNNKLRYSIISICFIYLLTPYSLTQRFAKTIFNILYNPSYKMTHEEVFKEITGLDFVNKKDLAVSLPEKPKNLIIIFLESAEQNFMDEKVFGNIAKDIKQLTKEGEYYSGIPEIEGSNWTMAGMHTLLCGSPRLYNIRKNKLFKTVTVSNLVCVSDVLKKAGYNQVYIGGEFKTFAGKSYFLELHGYDKTYGDKEIFSEYSVEEKDKWGWGAKDKEVFQIAKDNFIKLSKEEKPFNITLNTVAGHAPAGIYDERCRNTTDNSSTNAIECTNDQLKDFIDFLKEQPNYKDTIIVIAPDHLMMTSKATELLESVGERKLYTIMLNTGTIQQFDNKILYTDIATMVLEKMNIKHNAKFVMYNYNNEDVDARVKFLKENLDKIQTFNQKTIMQD